MQPGLTSLITYPPAGGPGWALSTLGHVDPPKYSYTIPGGCDQLTSTLYRPATWRHDAIKPGRLLNAVRGGSIVWAGILDEPQPSSQGGWALSAHGAGGEATNYRAIYTPPWVAASVDDCVNQAISRGLNWINPGIGNPSGMWIGQASDPASISVADVLSTVCHKGGLTWQVQTLPQGNILSVFALPTVANRHLVATGPVPTTVNDAADVLYLRYQATWDSGATPATFALTSVSNSDLITGTGRREDYADLSSAQTMSSGAAQAVGTNVLKRFTRAAFTQPFTLRYGDLLNMGGQPADLGAFYVDGLTAMMCKLVAVDFAYGGEVIRGAITFLVGAYEYDDATTFATLTPFDTIRHDFATLLSTAVDTLPVRSRPSSKHRKRKRAGGISHVRRARA